MLFGISGMLVSLSTLSLAFFINTAEDGTYMFDSIWAYALIVALTVYVGCYQISFGPVVWLLLSEIFPLHTRSRAQGLCILANFTSNAVMAWTYLSLTNAVSCGGSLLLYAVMCALAILFVYFKVPETKGLSLEEIQTLISGNVTSTRDELKNAIA